MLFAPDASTCLEGTLATLTPIDTTVSDGTRIGSSAGVLYRLVASKANYWIGFALDLVLGISLLAYGIARHPLGLAMLGAVFTGWLFFTFIEYAIHRWGYHGPDSPLSYVHRFHHSDGDVLVGAPFFYPLVIIAVVIGVAQLVIPFALVAVFAGTILVVYECQTFIHAIAHAWPGARGIRAAGLLKRLRRHHMIHHAGDGNVNYGMSTALWDHIFGTYAARVVRAR
jgi:sterol desaturase/sphingolipid hydroxylase (fatty acid hydroxylase superfamily)